MEVIRGIENVTDSCKGGVVTLGFFDGFHKGHQALAARAKSLAAQSGSHVVIYTFDRHPLEIVEPSRAPLLLTTLEEKIGIAEKSGVEFFLAGEFDQNLSRMEPGVFLKEIVADRLNARRLVVGYNYRYGRGHAGNVETLRRDAGSLGIPVEVVDAVIVGGEAVSSSRIRRVVAEGSVAEAASLLGRPYALTGTVVKGDGRGKTLGVPTANIKVDPRKLVPKIGIYAGIAAVEKSRAGALISIGNRPTFGGGERVIEIHLLDFNGDLYGKNLTVELTAWIRDEEKFSSAEALMEKMREDIAKGREVLERGTAAHSIQDCIDKEGFPVDKT